MFHSPLSFVGIRTTLAALALLAAVFSGIAVAADEAPPEPAVAPLLARAQAWDRAMDAGAHRAVLDDLDRIAPRLAAVRVAAAPDAVWSPSWGALCALARVRAERETGRPLDAWRTLRASTAHRPSTPPADAPLAVWAWRWDLETGKTCAALGRLMDAVACFQKVRQNAAPGTPLHMEATLALAAALNRQGRIPEAAARYAEIIHALERPPPSVWTDYITLLFNGGAFSAGVDAILAGTASCGLAESDGTESPLMSCARRYAAFFQPDDIHLWYEALSAELQTAPLAHGSESFFSSLLLTRNLIRRAWPDLFPITDDDALPDMAALRARVDAGPNPSLPTDFPDPDPADSSARGSRPADVPIPADDSSLLALEDRLNQLLAADSSDANAWEALLTSASTNDLRAITADGCNARFLALAGAGTALAVRPREAERAESLLRQALAEAEEQPGFNPVRLAAVRAALGNLALNAVPPRPLDAIRELERARETARGFRTAECTILGGLARAALLQDDGDRFALFAREMMDRCGCLPPPEIYAQLAMECARTGRFRDGFRVFADGFRRMDLAPVVSVGAWLEYPLRMRSFLTAAECRETVRLLQTAPLRLSPTPGAAPEIASLLNDSHAEWITTHLDLASLEESGNWRTPEGWTLLTNAVLNTPSIRAGILYTRAALEAAAAAPPGTPDAVPDWTGWLSAWNAVGLEIPKWGRRATDNGYRIAAYSALLDLYLPNRLLLSPEDQAAALDVFYDDAGRMGDVPFQRLLQTLASGNPALEFRLRFQYLRTYISEGPSVSPAQAEKLLPLLPGADLATRDEWIGWLRRRLKRPGSPADKDAWRRLILQSGASL